MSILVTIKAKTRVFDFEDEIPPRLSISFDQRVWTIACYSLSYLQDPICRETIEKLAGSARSSYTRLVENTFSTCRVLEWGVGWSDGRSDQPSDIGVEPPTGLHTI